MKDNLSFKLNFNESYTIIKKKDIDKIYIYDESISNSCIKVKQKELNCDIFLNFIFDNKFYFYNIAEKRYFINELNDIDYLSINFTSQVIDKFKIPPSKTATLYNKENKPLHGEFVSSDHKYVEFKVENKIEFIEIQNIHSLKLNFDGRVEQNIKFSVIDYVIPGIYEWRNQKKSLAIFLGLGAITSGYIAHTNYIKGKENLAQNNQMNTIGIYTQQYYLIDPSFSKYNQNKSLNNSALIGLGFIYIIHYFEIFINTSNNLWFNDRDQARIHFDFHNEVLHNSWGSNSLNQQMQFTIQYNF